MADFEVQGPAVLALVVWTGILVGVAVAVTRVAPVGVSTRTGVTAALGLAVGLPVVSALVVPVVGRRLSGPHEDDDLQREVERIADEVGVGTPAVRMTTAETPQVVPLPGTVGPPTLLVSRPVLGMAERERRAVLAHGVARLASGVALAATAGYGVVALIAGVSRGAGRLTGRLLDRDGDRTGDPSLADGEAAAKARRAGDSAHPGTVSAGQTATLTRFLLALPALVAILIVGPVAVVARHVLGGITRPGTRAADAVTAEVVDPETTASALEYVDGMLRDVRDRDAAGSPPMDALSVHPADDHLTGESLQARLTGRTHPPISDRVERLERADTGSAPSADERR